MPLAARSAALAAALSLPAALAAPVAAAPCSSDAFTIEGTAVTVSVCAPSGGVGAARTGTIALIETIGAPGREPFVRPVPLDLVRGSESRTIDDVPLARLGLAKTLHLTIELKAGNVRLEHALLVPGAISLK